jgi:DNA-binding transcriptional MerR regulator
MSLSSTSKPVINLRFESQTMILTIREIASKLHVHEQTLRNWERFGLLKISRIGANRTRIYDSNDLSRCKKILSFSEKGINLKGIKVLLGREKQNRNKTLAVQEKN